MPVKTAVESSKCTKPCSCVNVSPGINRDAAIVYVLLSSIDCDCEMTVSAYTRVSEAEKRVGTNGGRPITLNVNENGSVDMVE